MLAKHFYTALKRGLWNTFNSKTERDWSIWIWQLSSNLFNFLFLRKSNFFLFHLSVVIFFTRFKKLWKFKVEGLHKLAVVLKGLWCLDVELFNTSCHNITSFSCLEFSRTFFKTNPWTHRTEILQPSYGVSTKTPITFKSNSGENSFSSNFLNHNYPQTRKSIFDNPVPNLRTYHKFFYSLLALSWNLWGKIIPTFLVKTSKEIWIVMFFLASKTHFFPWHFVQFFLQGLNAKPLPEEKTSMEKKIIFCPSE